jgi:hypothetical protein
MSTDVRPNLASIRDELLEIERSCAVVEEGDVDDDFDVSSFASSLSGSSDVSSSLAASSSSSSSSPSSSTPPSSADVVVEPQRQWKTFEEIKQWVVAFAAEKGLKIVVDMKKSVERLADSSPPSVDAPPEEEVQPSDSKAPSVEPSVEPLIVPSIVSSIPQSVSQSIVGSIAQFTPECILQSISSSISTSILSMSTSPVVSRSIPQPAAVEPPAAAEPLAAVEPASGPPQQASPPRTVIFPLFGYFNCQYYSIRKKKTDPAKPQPKARKNHKASEEQRNCPNGRVCQWRVYWAYSSGYYRFTKPEDLHGEHRGHLITTKAEVAARPLTSVNEVPEEAYVRLVAFVQDKVSASICWKVTTSHTVASQVHTMVHISVHNLVSHSVDLLVDMAAVS